LRVGVLGYVRPRQAEDEQQSETDAQSGVHIGLSS
jgi:hypothetical protein